MIKLKVDTSEVDQALKKYKKLLNPKEKKWMGSKLISHAVALNRKRVRSQVNLDGSRMKSRKAGKGKMFKNILKEKNKQGRKQIRREATESKASAELTNPLAAKHQKGVGDHVKASDFKKPSAAYYKEPCTREQAKVLKKQVGLKKSLKWIQATYTKGTAGVMIKRYRARHGLPKRTRWTNNRPARDILGWNKLIAQSVSNRAHTLFIKFMKRKR